MYLQAYCEFLNYILFLVHISMYFDCATGVSIKSWVRWKFALSTLFDITYSVMETTDSHS